MKKKKIKKFLDLKSCLYFLAFLILASLVFFTSVKINEKLILKKIEKQVSYYKTDFSGECSIIIQKPEGLGFKFAYKPDQKIPAASLIKLPILAAALRAIEDGRFQFNQKVVVGAADIAGGSGIFKRVDLPLGLTFKELLSFMIIISDNSATNKVIDLLGKDYINKIFLSLGLKNTSLERKMMDFSSRRKGFENYTSSRDIVKVLKMIYNNQLIDRKLSLFARNLLSRQQYNDRIAFLLPKGIEVAHKTGLEKGVVHDAGIVYGEKNDFIICVLTKNVKNYKKAKEFIAEISKMSYNLLN
ncbi:MAG: class A beta-lactamase-related serine hydrolase [Candidatus Omnitrophica bacterium]|nr:class A beta-lactamase-related serine hydrolase [Candidatus Omnitrophota bacterium]MCF7878372.1 class A beta-lactamase-related serine hydrolase [Candidatus Omnitrophota bacterium]